MHTRDTAVQVRGLLWSAKNQNCTCTRCTHLGNTVGLPIPVLNPKCTKGLRPNVRIFNVEYVEYGGEL